MSGEFDVSGWVRRQAAGYFPHSPAYQIIAEAFVQEAIVRLSDPTCQGSEEVLKAIMRKRAAK